ncbi:substrate-binding periplasmic protein [Zooshikella sp. RANM57]|uniref:substrate-binding periplasmic protein n=1 Tax=Zooshikella sp. RANM57 TaxID=3425863 RepID=UPI003D6E8562
MKKILLLFTGILISGHLLADKQINICTDNNFWYPFTLVKEDIPAGIHIDIISKALNNLGYQPNFKALPWKRCLDQAKQGEFDAVATASYNEDRASFMYYPDDAASASKSSHRVMQVEYVVVTVTSNDYEFDGNLQSLPTPIRAPRGYSISEDLKKEGLNVDDKASGDENNIKKLLRNNKGSVVTIPEVVNVLSKQSTYTGKLKISSKPIKSKSYFMPFSKASNIAREQQQAIWNEIAKVRDDTDFMSKIASKY